MSSIFDEQRGRLCTICYHQYSCHGDAIPRILTCGHSFCTGCLRRVLGKLAHGHIRCPTCKGDTLVPGLSNDINKLSKNFGVLEILESIEEESRLGNGEANTIPLCSDHDNEPMKVFCIQDEQLICIYCQVYGVHREHQCQLVTILAEESRKTIQSIAERLSNQKDSMVAVNQAVNDTTGAVQIKEERLMYEVTQHFEMLRRKLHQREGQVKILLKNRMSAKVMLLDKQKRKLHDLISKVDQLSTSCQSVLSGPEYELVQQKTKLESDFQSLSSSIEDRDLRPCAKDDLHCHLDPSLLVQVSSHGMLVKEPVYRPQPDIVATESTASTSTAVASAVVQSVGSAGDADRRVGDRGLKWSAGMEASDRNNRQQRSLGLHDDMEQGAAASSSNNQRLQQSDIIYCYVEKPEHVSQGATGSSSRGSHTARNMTQNETKRQETLKFFSCLYDTENLNTNQDVSSSSDDEESPDLSASELSDMELERPLRSAWTNRGGWSATAVSTSLPQADREDTPSVLVESASGGVVGDVPSGVGTGEVDGEGDAQGTREETAIVANDGSDTVPAGEVEERRDEGNSWEVSATSSPRRVRRQGYSSSQHQRLKSGLVCSVFNCTSTNCSFYVRCKNCSRLFCQKCINTSVSARRCYKRPRGHSFLYIPVISTNGNQLYQRLSLMMHHGHQRSSCLRQHDRQPGSRLAFSESQLPAASNSWTCLHCLAVNLLQNGIQHCVSCGQVNESPPEVGSEVELMTFPPSPDDSLPSSSGAGDRTHNAEAQHDNPTPATGNQEAEIARENYGF